MTRRHLLAVGLVLAAAGPAAADPAAEEVRARVRAATGADAFRQLPHGVELAGRTEFQKMPGTFRLRLHADGRYAEVIDTRVGQARGFDGKTRWVKSLTGPALPADLADGDLYRLHYAVLAHRWLAPDAGYTVTTDPGENRAYRPCLVLRHPEIRGVAARVYVDPATWLPTRFSVFLGGGESVVELADWKDVSGAKVPGRVAVGAHGGGYVLAADAVTAAPPAADPYVPPGVTDTTFNPAAPPAVEARAVKGLLFVRPVINGKIGPWFQVSANSTASGITKTAADQFGLQAFGAAPANDPRGADVRVRYRPADRFAVGTATVAGLVLLELPTADADVAEFSKHLGLEFGGLLGADVLARIVLEADWTAGTAAVHDPATYRPGPALKWEAAKFDRETAYVAGTFDGKTTGLFAFASDASRPLVFAPGAVRAHDLLTGRATEPDGIPPSAPLSYKAAAAEFRALGHAARGVATRFVVQDAGADLYPYALGVLGPTTLGVGTVVFDYPNRRLGFAPRP